MSADDIVKGVKVYARLPQVDPRSVRRGGSSGVVGNQLTRVNPSQAGPPRFVTPPLPAGQTITLEEYRRWWDEREAA